MSAHHKHGWTSLKSAEKEIRAWTTSKEISLERIEHVATFEDWDTRTEVYLFFPTNSDLERHKAEGAIREIEALYRQFLSDAHYPFDRWPVVFHFDSHENVVKNYGGSYFYYLR